MRTIRRLNICKYEEYALWVHGDGEMDANRLTAEDEMLIIRFGMTPFNSPPKQIRRLTDTGHARVVDVMRLGDEQIAEELSRYILKDGNQDLTVCFVRGMGSFKDAALEKVEPSAYGKAQASDYPFFERTRSAPSSGNASEENDKGKTEGGFPEAVPQAATMSVLDDPPHPAVRPDEEADPPDDPKKPRTRHPAGKPKDAKGKETTHDGCGTEETENAHGYEKPKNPQGNGRDNDERERAADADGAEKDAEAADKAAAKNQGKNTRDGKKNTQQSSRGNKKRQKPGTAGGNKGGNHAPGGKPGGGKAAEAPDGESSAEGRDGERGRKRRNNAGGPQGDGSGRDSRDGDEGSQGNGGNDRGSRETGTVKTTDGPPSGRDGSRSPGNNGEDGSAHDAGHSPGHDTGHGSEHDGERRDDGSKADDELTTRVASMVGVHIIRGADGGSDGAGSGAGKGVSEKHEREEAAKRKKRAEGLGDDDDALEYVSSHFGSGSPRSDDAGAAEEDPELVQARARYMARAEDSIIRAFTETRALSAIEKAKDPERLYIKLVNILAMSDDYDDFVKGWGTAEPNVRLGDLSQPPGEDGGYDYETLRRRADWYVRLCDVMYENIN